MDTPAPVRREFRSRAPVAFFSAAGLVLLGYSIWRLRLFIERGSGDDLLSVVYFALFGGWFVAMFPGRKRPILEITPDEIRFGSVTWPRRRSIRTDEVVEVGEPSRIFGRLPLRLRSGRWVRLPFREIRVSERPAARAAIEAAVQSASEAR